MKIDISAEPATPPEQGVKVHVRKGVDMGLSTESVNICDQCGKKADVGYSFRWGWYFCSKECEDAWFSNPDNVKAYNSRMMMFGENFTINPEGKFTPSKESD